MRCCNDVYVYILMIQLLQVQPYGWYLSNRGTGSHEDALAERAFRAEDLRGSEDCNCSVPCCKDLEVQMKADFREASAPL